MAALVAVGAVLDELRRYHPDGSVLTLSSDSVRPDGRSAEWVLHVAAPDQGRVRHYRIRRGVLGDSGSTTRLGAEGAPALFTVAGGPPLGLIDSPRAVEVAEGAGAAVYRARTHVTLDNVMLYLDRNQVPVWFVGYSTRFTDRGATVEIDARSGVVLRYEEERVTKLLRTPTP